MTIDDARTLHQKAWDSLFDLVMLINGLLQSLDIMARRAIGITPVTGFVIEFDTGLARQLLDEIDTLTPQVSAGIEEVNQCAGKIGKPQIQWRPMEIRDDELRWRQ